MNRVHYLTAALLTTLAPAVASALPPVVAPNQAPQVHALPVHMPEKVSTPAAGGTQAAQAHAPAAVVPHSIILNKDGTETPVTAPGKFQPRAIILNKNGTETPVTAPGKFQPRAIILNKNGTETPVTAPGKFQPRSATLSKDGASPPAAGSTRSIILNKNGTETPVKAPGKFQPRSGETTEVSPASQKVADKIYGMNDTNETHRINGPQVVFGATKASDGTLTVVQLQPGTKGYDAAVGVTDHRLNGAPPIFNPAGEVVFQPHNTPL